MEAATYAVGALALVVGLASVAVAVGAEIARRRSRREARQIAEDLLPRLARVIGVDEELLERVADVGVDAAAARVLRRQARPLQDRDWQQLDGMFLYEEHVTREFLYDDGKDVRGFGRISMVAFTDDPVVRRSVIRLIRVLKALTPDWAGVPAPRG
jgi:hypothetical protein